MNKQCTELYAKAAGILAPKCKLCRGAGEIVTIRSGTDAFGKHLPNKPCPACAPLREIAGWKWHEAIDGVTRWHCSCGKVYGYEHNFVAHLRLRENNPTFTVQLHRATLEKMGLWERFTDNILSTLFEIAYELGCKPEHYYIPTPDFSWADTAAMAFDILTSDTLMTEAVVSFLKMIVEEG